MITTATMSLQPALGPYLERYHALQTAQLTASKLVEVLFPLPIQHSPHAADFHRTITEANDVEQDLLVYANDTENALRIENNTLSQRLQDAELDLDDARRSRRELQQQLNIATQRLSQYNMDNDNLKVMVTTISTILRSLTRAES